MTFPVSVACRRRLLQPDRINRRRWRIFQGEDSASCWTVNETRTDPPCSPKVTPARGPIARRHDRKHSSDGTVPETTGKRDKDKSMRHVRVSACGDAPGDDTSRVIVRASRHIGGLMRRSRAGCSDGILTL